MKHLITLALLCLTFTLSAQSRQGKVLLSGNTSVSVSPVGGLDNGLSWNVNTARAGYFFTDRLLVGTDVDISTIYFNLDFIEQVKFKPFLRYYLANPSNKKINYFAQLGFGTIGDFEFDTNYETDFHFGAGAEYRYSNDLSAEALLRYNANASGLNFTELSLRINTFIGGGNGKSVNPLLRGALMINPTGGSLQLGLRGRDNTSQFIGDLTLGGGFMVTDHLLVETEINFFRDALASDNVFLSRVGVPRTTSFGTRVGGRYLLGKGRLRPFAMAGTSLAVFRRAFNDFNGIPITPLSTTTANAYLGTGAFIGLTERVVFDGNVIYNAALSDNANSNWNLQLGLKVFLTD